MKGTDWSNFQPVPSPEEVAALVAADFTFAVVGLQQPGWAQKQTDALRAGGVTVEDCYMENNASPTVPAGIERIWVAVETGSGFTDEASIDAALAFVTGTGCAAGIYTSTYMVNLLGLDPAFEGKYAGVPLWLASYDGIESLPPNAAMKQYSGAGVIPGIAYQLDLDYKDDPPLPAQGDSTMETTPLDQGETIAITNKLFERFGHVITDDAGETAEEVTNPAPPAGYRRVVYTFREVP